MSLSLIPGSGEILQAGAVPVGHYLVFCAIFTPINMPVFDAGDAEPCLLLEPIPRNLSVKWPDSSGIFIILS